MLYIFIAAYLAGILSAFAAVFFLFCNNEEPPKKHIIVEAKLPQSLNEELKRHDSYQRKEPCISLNLLLQFFFQERQYDITIHHWLTNLLNVELAELRKHKTLSKIIHKMEIQSLSLGSNFPVVKTLTPSLVNFVKDSSVLDLVHLDVDLEYTGGIEITIDAYSRIAKKAIVKIKVEKLCGTARLLFSRQPFSHWGFTFYEEPEVKFDIQSSVLGHHIPKFRSLIDNQLRNVIRRKYVLPYYKLRTKPFIKVTPCELVPEPDAGIVIGGKLNLFLVNFSRLQECLLGVSMWCTISVCESPVICVYETQKEIWTILDIEITKDPQIPIGFVLDPGVDFQVVDCISAQSPAFRAGIKKGDQIVGVNGQPEISGSGQTARFIADSWNSDDEPTMVIRIKRFVISNKKTSSDQLITKDDSVVGNTISDKGVDENYDRKDSKTESGSAEEADLIESTLLDNKSGITESLLGEEEEKGDGITSKIFHNISDPEFKHDKLSDSHSPSPENKVEFKEVIRKFPSRCRPIIKHFESSPLESSSQTHVNAQCDMSLDEDCKFINVCLWSKPSRQIPLPEKNTTKEKSYHLYHHRRKKLSMQQQELSQNSPDDGNLPEEEATVVGYANFSVESLIDEASLTAMGHVMKLAHLKPSGPLCQTVVDHPLASHKGFVGEYCYGDITISALYTPAIPSDAKDSSCHSDDEGLTDASLSDADDDSAVGKEHGVKRQKVHRTSTENSEREHVFNRTHFSSATHCDFCRKKIWLKDAVQCSVCGIICHKKCMARCRQATACDLSGLRYKEIRDLGIMETPEIIMPDEDKEPVRRHSQNTKHTLGALLTHVGSATGSYISGSGLKRAGSAHNLAPPLNSDGSSLSRSLPPSPLHTPRHSRKTSLGGNPFLTEGPADDMERFLATSLQRVLSYPHIENLHQLAKQSASTLLGHCNPEDRPKLIECGLDILQKWISNEGSIRRDLAKQEKDACDNSNSVERARLSLLIAECDSRTQAVALITMQYCTAQQLITENSLTKVPKED